MGNRAGWRQDLVKVFAGRRPACGDVLGDALWTLSLIHI